MSNNSTFLYSTFFHRLVTPPVSKCHAERLQASYVPRQLEYPQYPHDTEDLCNPPHLRLSEALALAGGAGPGGLGHQREDEGHEVRQDPKQVYYVHHPLYKPE